MRSKKPILPIIAILLVTGLVGSCVKRDAEAPKGDAPSKLFVFKGRPGSDITFLSTQMNPVEEAGKMRNTILKDFPGRVDFRPNDNSYLFSQIDTILKSDPSKSILIGALHGDLAQLREKGDLRPLNDIFGELGDRTFSKSLVDLGRLDGKDIYYVPWMQASFVMVANRKALPYLPKGADLKALTYGQLRQWAQNIQGKTGKKALGFPAGEKGLMHRFFQGYLYPSYTGGTLLKFRGRDAVTMWMYFKDLWNYVHPGSLVYSTMSEPLLAGDVWIAWDHTARIVKAFEEKPEDFVAFPAPIGPKGRGFMAVVSGLSVPKSLSDAKDPALLIDYLTQPTIQDRTFKETGFFPVVASPAGGGGSPGLQGLREAVDAQADSRDAVPTLVPMGLGTRSGDFNNLFMLTFSEIVLDGRDLPKVLEANAGELQAIIDAENARCWLPDVSDERPCKLE